MSEAERLAGALETYGADMNLAHLYSDCMYDAAAELRRLSAELEECQAQRRAAFRRIEEQDKELDALKKAMGEPVFWYRPVSGGEMYEGPHHNNSANGVISRKEQPNEWVPLYALTKDQS